MIGTISRTTTMRKSLWWGLGLTAILVLGLQAWDEPPSPTSAARSAGATSAETARRPKAEPTADLSALNLPAIWPERPLVRQAVVDAFQTGATPMPAFKKPAPLAAAAPTAVPEAGAATVAAAATPPAPPAPPAPPVQDGFAYTYFGHLDQGQGPAVFFRSADSQVLSVRVGDLIDRDWKLTSFDARRLTVRHEPSGQNFQQSLTESNP